MCEKKINYYKGKEQRHVDESFLRTEMSKLLQVDNLNFLIGAGCSSHIVDDEEKGILNMKSLYNSFFESNPDFEIAGKPAKEMFDENLEKMLEVMGAIDVANQVMIIDKEIGTKITDVQCFIKEEIVKGINSEVVRALYREFYQKTVCKGRKKPINVFTTNYDLFNEQALDSLAFPYNNGFVGTYERKFNPVSYKYAYVEDMNLSNNIWERVPNFYNLYKLHGSITWVKEHDEIYERDYRHISTNEGVMIYPTPMKDRSTLMTPYSDLFRAMETALTQKNCVLITLGYSFADDHINRLILNAMAIPTFRLVVFGDSSNIDKLIEINDKRIIVVNSDDQIHYFKNFIERAMPEMHEDLKEELSLQTSTNMVEVLKGEIDE